MDGKLIHRAGCQYTHGEWPRFLKQIGHEVPPDIGIHLIAVQCSTHKHAQVKEGLAGEVEEHSHAHRTLVKYLEERFFAGLTVEC